VAYYVGVLLKARSAPAHEALSSGAPGSSRAPE
jgi:hypothetical protein